MNKIDYKVLGGLLIAFVAGLAALAFTSCEKPIIDDDDEVSQFYAGNANVLLYFDATNDDATRAVTNIDAYFRKLNVMIFDSDGNKVLTKVRTQTADDENFGSMSMTLAEGTYTVVAVGHSSTNSATIKSDQMVQFTASNGEKLTDTFCYCGILNIGEEPEEHSLIMNRATAMIRFVFTDTLSDNVASVKFEYSGGSANFNPSTLEGTTKSKQSENRPSAGHIYSLYTFPYMATSGVLAVTISVLGEDGTTAFRRVITNVPVTRNRITTFTGRLFDEGSGEITQTGFGFLVNGEWEGEDHHEF